MPQTTDPTTPETFQHLNLLHSDVGPVKQFHLGTVLELWSRAFLAPRGAGRSFHTRAIAHYPLPIVIITNPFRRLSPQNCTLIRLMPVQMWRDYITVQTPFFHAATSFLPYCHPFFFPFRQGEQQPFPHRRTSSERNVLGQRPLQALFI